MPRCVAQKLGKPVKWTETRSESLLAGPPRPRPDPGHHDRRQAATAPSPAWTCDLLADMGAYLRPGRRRASRSSARSCSTRSTRSRPTSSPARTSSPPRRPTDAYRGAGRPEATFAIERIMDELAVELGRDPMELREQNWIKHEEFPFTTVGGLDLRLGQLRGRPPHKAMELFDYDGLRREQAGAARRAATRSSSASASRPSPRCAGSPRRGVLGSLAYGAGGWETASIRMLPTGKVEVVTGVVRARAGPRDGVEPDRRRPARRAVRGRRGAARRHPGLAEGHGHLRLAVAGRRRHRRRQGRGEGRRQGQARSPRTCSRRPRTTSSSPTAASRSRAPDKGKTIQEVALGRVRGARPARRHRARPGLRRHVRPGELLLPARHPPARDRGRHRDRAGRRSASTSASTTSATWSTR